jgi:hypothetical protein
MIPQDDGGEEIRGQDYTTKVGRERTKFGGFAPSADGLFFQSHTVEACGAAQTGGDG